MHQWHPVSFLVATLYRFGKENLHRLAGKQEGAGTGVAAAPSRWRGGRWTPGPFHLFLSTGEQRRSDPAAPPPQTTGSKRGCCPKGGPPAASRRSRRPPEQPSPAPGQAAFSVPPVRCAGHRRGEGGFSLPICQLRGERKGEGAAYLSAPTSVCAFSSNVQCQEKFLCRLNAHRLPQDRQRLSFPCPMRWSREGGGGGSLPICQLRGERKGEGPPTCPPQLPCARSPQMSSAKRSFSAT